MDFWLSIIQKSINFVWPRLISLSVSNFGRLSQISSTHSAHAHDNRAHDDERKLRCVFPFYSIVWHILITTIVLWHFCVHCTGNCWTFISGMSVKKSSLDKTAKHKNNDRRNYEFFAYLKKNNKNDKKRTVKVRRTKKWTPQLHSRTWNERNAGQIDETKYSHTYSTQAFTTVNRVCSVLYLYSLINIYYHILHLLYHNSYLSFITFVYSFFHGGLYHRHITHYLFI